MLHIKEKEQIEKENIEKLHFELIKMKFIAETQFTKSNVDYFVNEQDIDDMVETIVSLYGSYEKLENLKNRVLANIELLEQGLKYIDKFDFDPYLLYKGLYNDIFIFSSLPTVKEKGFNIWYSARYKSKILAKG